MPIDSGHDIPKPQEAVPKTPEINPGAELKKEFDTAGFVGRKLEDINHVRQENGYYSFTANPVLSEFYQAVKPKPQAEITELSIKEAKKGSVGLSLEGARQINDGDISPARGGGVNEDVAVLQDLGITLRKGSELAQDLSETDRKSFDEVARKVVAAQLGKKPEEVEMSSENLANWVAENYNRAHQKLLRQHDALDSYLRT